MNSTEHPRSKLAAKRPDHQVADLKRDNTAKPRYDRPISPSIVRPSTNGWAIASAVFQNEQNVGQHDLVFDVAGRSHRGWKGLPSPPPWNHLHHLSCSGNGLTVIVDTTRPPCATAGPRAELHSTEQGRRPRRTAVAF